MDPDAAKKFLLVQSVEEADREGAVIPLGERGIAKAECEGAEGAGADVEDAILSGRAEQIYRGLVGAHPRQIEAAVVATGPHGWLKLVVVLVALAIGLATKQLGPERRINVLAFPLFGLLAWNVLIYVGSLAGVVLRNKLCGPGAAILGGILRKFSERVMRRFEAAGDQALACGLSRFVGRWYELTSKARMARARACLHLGAVAFSVGVVAGMYWNGLAHQYLAAWESTFLSPEGVRLLFSVLFAPASAVSGIAAPGLDEICAMELVTGAEGVGAADWIHLFAITVGLSVVLPRSAMAWFAHRKAVALEGSIDLRQASAAYIERLLRMREGGNLVARLIPHRMELGSKERDRLRALVHQLWGGQLWVEFSDPIAYGDEDDAEFEGGDFQVLVLNFSTTPEDDSQGRLVGRFRDQLVGVGLVLVEVEPFRERFGGLGEFERRLAERRAAWEAVLGRAGVGFVMFDRDAEAARLAAGDVLLKPREKSNHQPDE